MRSSPPVSTLSRRELKALLLEPFGEVAALKQTVAEQREEIARLKGLKGISVASADIACRPLPMMSSCHEDRARHRLFRFVRYGPGHRGSGGACADQQILGSSATGSTVADLRPPGCNWVGRVGWWLALLHERILSTTLASPKVFADDTTLPVLDPEQGRT